jgi:glycerol-3-phosphate acyltransferase PlsY
MQTVVLLIFSYLLGSIPFGLIIAYLVKRIDIRDYGSGNIGATNVFRVLGKRLGITVFILDFFKGLFPLVIARAVGGFSNTVIILAAVAVVCGHNWTIFLKFKGGKGVATSVGAICGISLSFGHLFWALLIAIGAWLGCFIVSRYVSLASLVSAAAFFISSLCFPLPFEIKIFTLALCIMVVVRHKKNIVNLLAKKENRF